jgi:hypothetical protein
VGADEPKVADLRSSILLPSDRTHHSTWEGVLSLEDVAGKAFDPRTEQRLRDLGYVAGYQRDLIYDDGYVSHSAYEFRDAAAAIEYQEAITMFACAYANEAFSAPDDGIGLQLRYAEAPRVRDQISWADGSRRHLLVVARGEFPSRETVLELYAQARAIAALPSPTLDRDGN